MLRCRLGDAEGFAEGVVDGRQLLFVDGRHGDRKHRGLAGDHRAAVVGGEVHGDAACLARRRAARAVLELGEHLPLAEHELDVGPRAALEGLALDPPLEVDGDAVTVSGGTLHGDEIRTLAPHGFDHGVDVGLGDLGTRPLDREVGDRLDGEIGQHFEHRREAQLCARLRRDAFDTGVGRRTQFFAAHGLGIRLAQQIADDLGLDLRGELLLHDRERRLTRAEALQARGACELLQAHLDLAGDSLGGDGHFKAALEAGNGAH